MFERSLKLTALVPCLLLAAQPALANTREVLSTVIYTNNGDRIPLITNDYHRLTPLGAQQMYDAGARLRTQYISPEPNTTEQTSQTWRLPPVLLDGEFLTVLTTREPYQIASAQAFMQGLYPPLFSDGKIGYIDASFYDANNNITQGPLDGMQFPPIWTSSDQYLNSMHLKGATTCPMFTDRLMDYISSTKFDTLNLQSADLYKRLNSQFLQYIDTPDVTMGYANAWEIYDYLNYMNNHNSSFAENLDPVDLAMARVLASDWVFDLYANTTEEGKIGQNPLDAIAGRTLASLIFKLFADSILSGGSMNKVNLLFGDHIAMVSFAALAELIVPQHSQFYNLPAPGASFIFELYAMVPDEGNSTDYPASPDMFVRFLYTNGTGGDASTIEYPLFGASPSQAVMTLSDFTHSMSNIMISNRTQWCDVCQSTATFCLADKAVNLMTTPSSNHLSPVVAGVIGALVALAFALIVIGSAMLLGGVRLYRVQTKRRSELGGFKGAEKLASDQDLTLPKGSAGAVVTETNAQDNRGHERVGSWELRDQAKAKDIQVASHSQIMGGTVFRRSSFDDDEIHVNPFSDPVRPRDSV